MGNLEQPITINDEVIMEEKTIVYITREELGDVVVNEETLYQAIEKFFDSSGLQEIIAWIIEKNKKYGNSWAEDGLAINFADIKDKLNRMKVILTQDGIKEETSTSDGYGDVLLDLWVRTTLCLIWDSHVKEFIFEKYGIDIDKDQSDH